MPSRIVLLVLVVLSACLAGCGASQSAGGLTLRIWYSTDDPVERGWSQHLARQFEQNHPHVRVQLTDYSFADLNTKLQLALSAGNPPDLAYVTPRGPGIPAYVGAHRLRDLSAAARARGWAGKLRPDLLAVYNRPFAFLGARRGSVIAVPTSLAAVGVLYNARLLARLHLSVPSSLASFEHAAATAAAAGYVPIGIGNADGWLGDDWYLTLVNALAPPSALEAEQRLDRHFSFQGPPYLEAAHILRQWAARSWFTPNFGGLDAQEGIDQFFQGRTLFQLVSSSQNSQILRDQQQTRLPVGVFAFPGPNGSRVMPVAGYLGWVVPQQSRQPSLAVSFIDSLLTPNTTAFLEAQGLMPAYRTGAPKHRGQALPWVGTQGVPGPGAPAEAAAAAPSWQADYLHALDTARPGVYLDAAPVANLNATMEANVQLLLQGYEGPQFLVTSLQKVYTSRGNSSSSARIDGEF